MSIALSRLSRPNRGKKITLPTEEDENFWNQEFFAEESEGRFINFKIYIIYIIFR